MSAGTDSRSYARLLLMMRRLVKEEFGVTVHLGEEEAAEELLAFAERSRHHLLRQMAKELAGQLGLEGIEVSVEVQPAADVTYYRGAPVSKEPSAAGDAADGSASHSTKRIYRGRVIA